MVRPLVVLALVACSCATPPPTPDAPPASEPERPAPPAPIASSTAAAPPPAIASSTAAAPPPALDASLPSVTLDRNATVLEARSQHVTIPYFLSPGGRPHDGSPIGMEVHGLDARAEETSERYPFDPNIDFFAVVLQGRIQVAGAEALDKTLFELGPWRGFRALGAGVRLSAPRGENARVLVVIIKSPPATPIATYLPDAERPDKWPKRPATFRRASPIASFDFHEQRDLAWAGGANRARIGWDDAKSAASVGALLFGKNSAVAEHVHETSWECVYVIRGAGEIVFEGTRERVAHDSRVCIPKGKKHAFRPAGTEPLVAIQVYAPPGPEQRFKALAAAP